MSLFHGPAYAVQSRQDVHQPRAAILICLIFFCSIFAIYLTIGMIFDLVSAYYMPSPTAMGRFIDIFFAMFGLCQLLVALLADRYIGLWRALRGGLLLAVIAFFSIFLLFSIKMPQIVYAGQAYHVELPQSPSSGMSIIDAAGHRHKVMVQEDGALDVAIPDAEISPLARHIPAHAWQMSNHGQWAAHGVIILVISFFLLAGAFWPAVAYGVLGHIYGQRDGARVMGFTIMYIFMNAGLFCTFLFLVAGVPSLGHQGLMGLALLAMLVALYIERRLRAHFAQEAWAQPSKNSPRKRAIAMWLVCVVLFVLLVLGDYFLNLRVSSHGASLEGRLDFLLHHYLNFDFLILIYGLFIIFFFARALLRGARQDFYAILCVTILSLLLLVSECLFGIGSYNLRNFSQSYVDLSVWGLDKINPDYMRLANPLTSVIVGSSFLFIWLQLRHHFAPLSDLVKSFIAFAMIGCSYLIISIGTHDLRPDLRVPFMYLAIARLLMSFAEVLLAPALTAAVFRLRQNHMPATALALFALPAFFSSIVCGYLARLAHIETVEPVPGAMAETQMAFGKAFLTAGTVGLVGALIVFFALLPMFTRWMGIAHGPRPPRQEFQRTGFDRD